MKRVINSRSELASAIAGEALGVIRESIASNGSCRLVLTGGGLGMEVLAELSALPIDWPKVTILFSDERFVGVTHPDRNESQALERLPQLLDANWLRYPDTSSDLESSADEFSNELERVFGTLDSSQPIFDLVLLGMGPDGHVASLFPGRLHAKQWIVTEDSSPKPPSMRLSLSYQALCRAQRVWFLVAGRDKADATTSAMKNSDLPAGRVRGISETIWWIDQELSDEF